MSYTGKLVLLLLVVMINAREQSVSGRIYEGQMGRPLSGVQVIFANDTVQTDTAGKFRYSCSENSMPRLVKIYRYGFISDSLELNFIHSSDINIDVKMVPAMNLLPKIVVQGRFKGESGSFNKKRKSDNYKEVLDADLIAALPDHSTGDAVQRASGVSIQREQGEGRYVQIRGTEPGLSTVTMNGQAIGSTDGQGRAVALNVIPSDQLAEIEVTKVLMPELDGDAIGGTVNLITRRAEDSILAVRVTLMPGYSTLNQKPLYQGSFTLGKRFIENQRLGLMLNGSYYNDDKETQNAQFAWDTLISEFRNMDFRDYQKSRERIAAGLTIDYRFDNKNELYLMSSYNRNVFEELRYRLEFNAEHNVLWLSPNEVSQVSITRSLRNREKRETIFSTLLGGRALFGSLRTEGKLQYSSAVAEEPNRQYVNYTYNYPEAVKFGQSSAGWPSFVLYNSTMAHFFNQYVYDTTWDKELSLYRDYDNQNGSERKRQSRTSNEQSYSASGNASYPFLFNAFDLDLKTGFKYSFHTKSQSLSEKIDSIGPADLSDVAGNYNNSDILNGHYKLNGMPDADKVNNLYDKPLKVINVPSPIDTARHNDRLEIDPQNFDATDQNIAGFMQGKAIIGKLSLVGGVRLEYTSMDYSSYFAFPTGNLDNDFDHTEKIEAKPSFFFALPMILGRYSLTSATGVRASYTRSFARPDWFDVVPHDVTTNDDGLFYVRKGNPDLRPPKSHNLDLSLEHFFSGREMVALALFYKRIDDYIFSHQLMQYNEMLKTDIYTYQKINGNFADLLGVEVAIGKQLGFLPSFGSGFGVQSNYTYTYSSTRLPNQETTTQLPGQSTHVGNIALIYEKFGFSGRLALNHRSRYIHEQSTYLNKEGSIYPPAVSWVDDHTQFDASVSQKIGKLLTVVLEISNITNSPYRLYLNTPDYPLQIEYYGSSWQLGLRMTF